MKTTVPERSESLEPSSPSTGWSMLLGCMFIVYALVVIRIILFKGAPLYNLFAGAGIGTREVSLIPFASTIELFTQQLGMGWLLENMVGNLVLFVPLGMLLPLLWRTDGKRTVLLGVAVSLSFEVLQYAFAWGSSDIDDVLYNTAGTLIGWLIFRFGAARLSDPALLKKVFSLLLLLVGTVGLAVLFYTNSSLFQIVPKKVIVENGELLQPVEHQAAYAAGRVKKLDDTSMELEKSIQQAGEARQLVKLTLTEKTTLLREFQAISMVLDIITKEVIRYEPLSYADFTHMRDSFAGQNVRVWSQDGKTADVVLFQQLTMD